MSDWLVAYFTDVESWVDTIIYGLLIYFSYRWGVSVGKRSTGKVCEGDGDDVT